MKTRTAPNNSSRSSKENKTFLKINASIIAGNLDVKESLTNRNGNDLSAPIKKFKVNHLSDTNSRFDEIYDFYYNSPLGHIVVDKNAIILSTNLSGAAMLGSNVQQIINTRFYDYIPADSKEVFNNFMENICPGKINQSLEIGLLHEDGDVIFIKIIGLPSKKEGHLQLTLLNISEQKLRDQEIERTRKHYMAII